jgi:3'-phosphoadenosine 5'-phosphosulfate (PAPS) 3'-phosphatase
MEWDTAAGDAVLRAAGGAVLQLDGAPLVYGKAAQSFRNGGFVCWGDPRRVEALFGAAASRPPWFTNAR